MHDRPPLPASISSRSPSSSNSEGASAGPKDNRRLESQRRQAASTSCNTPGDTGTQRFDVSQCQTTRCLIPRTPSVDRRCGRNRKYNDGSEAPRGSPPWMARSNLNLRRASLRWTPAAFDIGNSFADHSPPGMARSNLSPRMTSLRSTHQQPSKVATVSQLAPPQARRGLI